jgi:hypothetical protein
MPRALAFLVSTLLLAQQPSPDLANANPTDQPAAEPDVEFICPMDKDVRSKTPGNCSRCGMKLVAGLPDPHEFPVRLTTKPKVPKANESLQLSFRIDDPDTSKPVREYETVHEKLFHLFLVSQDMSFFVHTHPQIQPDGSFQLDTKLPKAGLYRVLSDFYPKGATPQLIASTLMVPGQGFKLGPAKLEPDMKPQKSENIDVELVTEPQQPIVGEKTLMFFRLKPVDGLEPYLGAMGHMLAASSDLIDMIHSHPFLVYDPREADYKQIQFNMIFPRTGVYRVWVQFQRKGVVNTVAFNVPVSELK